MILEILYPIQRKLYQEQQELWWTLRDEGSGLYERFERCWMDYGYLVDQIKEDLT